MIVGRDVDAGPESAAETAETAITATTKKVAAPAAKDRTHV
jgi:hypothetical protein